MPSNLKFYKKVIVKRACYNADKLLITLSLIRDSLNISDSYSQDVSIFRGSLIESRYIINDHEGAQTSSPIASAGASSNPLINTPIKTSQFRRGSTDSSPESFCGEDDVDSS